MRSKATQRIKDRKRISRRRKIVRCSNAGRLFGESARIQQRNVGSDRWMLGSALGHFFGQLFSGGRGPRKPDAKDWDQ